jgi:hypothetical protein
MAIVGRDRTTYGIRATGQTTTVPGDHEGRLMYYLNCCKIVGYNLPELLTDYKRNPTISWTDTYRLRDLCITFRPDGMDEFLLVSDCGAHSNEFLELTATRELLALGISSNAIAALRQRRQATTKIMIHTRAWANTYYYEPMAKLNDALRRHEQSGQKDSDVCLIA